MAGDYRPDPVVESAASTASSDETGHTDHADESTPAHEVRCPTCLHLMADDRALRHHTPHCTPSDEARRVQARQEAASVRGSLSRPDSSVPVFSDTQWAQLDSVDWREYLFPSWTHARPLRCIPSRVRGGISDVLREITSRMEKYPDADGPHILFTAVPTLFLAPATPPERGHTASIAARVARFFRGTDTFVTISLRDRLERMAGVLPWLPRLRQPQTAARLLSACVSTRPQYLARTVPPSPEVRAIFAAWDACLGATLQQLLVRGTWRERYAICEAALEQAFLPIRIGGFGIRRMERIAPVSYLCSWVQCAPILCSLPSVGEGFRQSFASGDPTQIDPYIMMA
ncbi:hypothetical protein CLOP_g10522 [Closterium sp. NIES-67]|nr:hypothetical protein CLOP_g10522 [Closterium sp. NIES-67]